MTRLSFLILVCLVPLFGLSQTLNFQSNERHYFDEDGIIVTKVKSNITITPDSIFINNEPYGMFIVDEIGECEVTLLVDSSPKFKYADVWVMHYTENGEVDMIEVYMVIGANIRYLVNPNKLVKL